MGNNKYIRQAQYLRPKIIIMSGYGLNCEEETKFAFESAGGMADIVHINDLIAKPKMLFKYQILVFPGGFSYGDDTGSGKAYANKFKNHLAEELREFLSGRTLAIGICNGFQIMTNLSILPGALTYKKNPNGSDYDIAGVLAYNGRVLGLMPHPERAMFSHQSPLWYKNKKIPKDGKGLQIFKNAINYFRK